ncbi:hypothetical protein K435DRAFT_872687 [Dendrothele bispora CBS 962.96]|uniref:Uncharacterized protein n=1 Tax=Dendrothele bispora (strain CBS 962.96) TaxID=1314807 RepID=A0A4S8L107_DENBC|nr:hypothetical protein K435DRAFT_872687 [Dendrothele bispora CBS 962.96]
MTPNNADEFRGCSPKLFTELGPSGTAGLRYKYYLLQDGSKAGIYMDQKLASALAMKTKQREPKGFGENQQQLLIDTWKYHCSHVHDHPPSELLPFINPFDNANNYFPARDPSPQRPNMATVHWQQDELTQALQMIQTLTINVPSSPSTPSRSKDKSPFSPSLSKATFAKVDLNSNTQPDPVKASSSFRSRSCSPSKPAASSKAKASCSRSSSPSKSFPGVALNSTSEVPSSAEEEEEPMRFFVVRFKGGADYFSTRHVIYCYKSGLVLINLLKWGSFRRLPRYAEEGP